MDHTAAFYMRPSYEFHGSGFPVFHGSRRQRGGSIFGSLAKMFSPIAKSVGRQLLSHGVGLAKDIASDALAGRNIKDSLISRGKATASNIGKSALRQGIGALSQMVGRGKRRRKRLSPHKRKAKRPVRRKSRSKTSRKRKRAATSTHKRTAKRRRVSHNF